MMGNSPKAELRIDSCKLRVALQHEAQDGGANSSNGKIAMNA